LDRAFRGRTANPKLRYHEKAAVSVLRGLLPETGTEIKGHMRSEEELRQIAGYGSDAGKFSELLEALDAELKIVAPSEPEPVVEQTTRRDHSESDGRDVAVPRGANGSIS
jgi:hypothetical protein